MPLFPATSTRLLWPQTWGLALIQGAIGLLWLTYSLYLPTLLIQAGLSEGAAAGIILTERVLAIFVEPLMGLFSDRQRHTVASRMPLVTIGVSLTAVLTLGLPLMAVWSGVGRLLLPTMLVLWAMAMSLFRVPMMALLGRYASRTQLPYAAGLLTLVGALTGTVSPWLRPILVGLGAPIAFGLATVVLVVAALALTWVGPDEQVTQPADAPEGVGTDRPEAGVIGLPLLVMVGAVTTLSTGLLTGDFSKLLPMVAMEPPLFFSTMAIATAVMALPAGRLISHWGVDRAFPSGLVGLLAMAIPGLLFRLGWGSVGLAIASAILLGALLSLIGNAMVPLALRLAPRGSLGLGTGAYVAGAGLASTLASVLGSQIDPFGLGIAAIGFGLATLLAAIGCRVIPPPRTMPETASVDGD